MKLTSLLKFLPVFIVLLAGCQEKEMEKEEVAKEHGGLALYTLREELTANPDSVLRAVKAIGYSFIEAASYENGN